MRKNNPINLEPIHAITDIVTHLLEVSNASLCLNEVLVAHFVEHKVPPHPDVEDLMIKLEDTNMRLNACLQKIGLNQ